MIIYALLSRKTLEPVDLMPITRAKTKNSHGFIQGFKRRARRNQCSTRYLAKGLN
jgi:hypothetical protein